MTFNTLDAQRDACEAYIASQRQEGWVLAPDYYDDGGFSGATLERPALQRLIADIEDGQVDVIVVYKIDRLSRSLMDFARLVEIFDRNDVTFVSVTQAFNTTTSMGRLTLNILLSFAQFEREVIGERIRDKFAASRRRGIWMGGTTPFGYRVENRKLVIVEKDAAVIRMVFERFVRLGSGTKLAQEFAREGVVTNRGRLIDKGVIYKILHNRVYIGQAVHKGASYPGEHKAIIPMDLWERAHAILATDPRTRAGSTRARTPALLKGVIWSNDGRAMSPSHTRKKGRLYRYYIHQAVLKSATIPKGIVARVPAAEIEALVINELRQFLTSPEIIAGTWREAKRLMTGQAEQIEADKRQGRSGRPGKDAIAADAARSCNADHAQQAAITGEENWTDQMQAVAFVGPETGHSGKQASASIRSATRTDSMSSLAALCEERDVFEALEQLEPLWNELFPVEQARIVRLLVERIEVAPTLITVRFRMEGFGSLAAELNDNVPAGQAKARQHASTAIGTGTSPRDQSFLQPADRSNRAEPDGNASHRSLSPDGRHLIVHIPFELRQTGGRKLIISADDTHHPAATAVRIDSTIVKALARAFRWRSLLETHAIDNVHQIAKAEHIHPSYVSRLLRLTLLAPDIVEAILAGRQPTHLQLDALTQVSEVEWEQQRRVIA